MANPDTWLGRGKFNVSQYLTFISSLEGAKKSMVKLDGGPWLDFHPRSAPGILN